MSKLLKLIRNEKGATAIEYGLIAALIAVAAIGADVKGEAGGLKRLTMPDGNSVFVKHEGSWSFLARNAASLTRVPKDPQTAFSKLLADNDFAARASAQNVPPMYRNLAVLTLQSAMQQQLQRQANESDADYALRQESVQAQMQQAVDKLEYEKAEEDRPEHPGDDELPELPENDRYDQRAGCRANRESAEADSAKHRTDGEREK